LRSLACQVGKPGLGGGHGFLIDFRDAGDGSGQVVFELNDGDLPGLQGIAFSVAQ